MSQPAEKVVSIHSSPNSFLREGSRPSSTTSTCQSVSQPCDWNECNKCKFLCCCCYKKQKSTTTTTTIWLMLLCENFDVSNYSTSCWGELKASFNLSCFKVKPTSLSAECVSVCVCVSPNKLNVNVRVHVLGSILSPPSYLSSTHIRIFAGCISHQRFWIFYDWQWHNSKRVRDLWKEIRLEIICTKVPQFSGSIY